MCIQEKWSTPEGEFATAYDAYKAGYEAAKNEKDSRFMSVTVDSCIPTDQIRFIFNGEVVGIIKDIAPEEKF